MAGRPKMMAEKVAGLEAKTEEVWNLISEYIPEQYENDTGPLANDPLCKAWCAALNVATDSMYIMEDLARSLRAKAGIAEPESSTEFLAKSREAIARARLREKDNSEEKPAKGEAPGGVPTRLETGVLSSRMSLGRRTGVNSNGDGLDP